MIETLSVERRERYLKCRFPLVSLSWLTENWMPLMRIFVNFWQKGQKPFRTLQDPSESIMRLRSTSDMPKNYFWPYTPYMLVWLVQCMRSLMKQREHQSCLQCYWYPPYMPARLVKHLRLFVIVSLLVQIFYENYTVCYGILQVVYRNAFMKDIFDRLWCEWWI